MKISQIIIIIFSFVNYLNAEINDLHFKNITVENGLSQSWVKCIFQDSYGFMWFGTQDGLNKYDGYTFTIYQREKIKGQGLIDAVINQISEDSDKNILICTSKGIDLLKRNSNTF